MNKPKLLGLAEIAELYGISKTSANAWTRRHDFPTPIALLAMGPVWDLDEVCGWRNPVVNHRLSVPITCAYCGSKTFQSMVHVDTALCECGMITKIQIAYDDCTITLRTIKPEEA